MAPGPCLPTRVLKEAAVMVGPHSSASWLWCVEFHDSVMKSYPTENPQLLAKAEKLPTGEKRAQGAFSAIL